MMDWKKLEAIKGEGNRLFLSLIQLPGAVTKLQNKNRTFLQPQADIASGVYSLSDYSSELRHSGFI